MGPVPAIRTQRVGQDSAAFGRLFVDLGNEGALPAMFHCTAGKDRTAWAAAALLARLGVHEAGIVADYLRTKDYIFAAYQKYIDGFVAGDGDPAIVKAIFSAKAEYLRASFDEMNSRYGTIEDYFTKALEIDAAGLGCNPGATV